jgi:hypothetical protein
MADCVYCGKPVENAAEGDLHESCFEAAEQRHFDEMCLLSEQQEREMLNILRREDPAEYRYEMTFREHFARLGKGGQDNG